MNSNQVPCPRCGKLVSRKNMSRHLKTCGEKPKTIQPQRPCPSCGVSITLSNFNRHLKKCSPTSLKRKNEEPVPFTSKVPCTEDHPTPGLSTSSSIVDTVRSSIVSAYNTVKTAVGNLLGARDLEIEETESAFECRMKTYVIRNQPQIKDPVTFLEKSRDLIREKIVENVRTENIKTNVVFLVEYTKPINDNEEVKEMNFKTQNVIIFPTTDIDRYLKDTESKLLAEMEEFYTKGSGWSVSKILSLQLAINKYKPLRGSTYISLQPKIKVRQAVLNIQNNDEKCFLWCILAALHPIARKDQPHRLQHYLPFEHDLDQHLQGIEFPVSLDNVLLFEKRSGISVNVYAYTEKFVLYPLLVTNQEQPIHIDLLYIKDEKNSHYCLIKDLARLAHSQLTKHCRKIWICRRCLQYYGREDLLKSHSEYCKDQQTIRIDMPKQGSTIKFEEGNKKMRVPFVGYADFESMLVPTGEEEQHEQLPDEPHTRKYQKHEAVSFSYYIVYADGDYGRPEKYFGSDAAKVFVESMFNESRKIAHLYSSEAARPMEITSVDMLTISNSQVCHICEKPFTNPDDHKVRDHDHLTGRFRGIAHNSCNLKFRKPNFIPIFIHNLSGYDTHLFIKMFGLNDETISVIPNNEERYISYTVEIEGGVKLRFLDSCRFMPSSLDALAKNLSLPQFRHTSKFYSGEQLQLLVKKGFYPYDYMDSLEKYQLTSLPEQNHFYNKLNRTDIEDKDYEHAKKVWAAFNIVDMEEYTLLYNQTDVLLLADIIENFRDLCINTYTLDPAWYYTAPGLAWSAMLKTTGIELELLTDNEMRLMIAKGIRGGVSQCSHRHARANNPYMEDYDVEQATKYLMYLDANNLYGWAMSQAMPYANFRWVENPEAINIMDIPDDADEGIILEVDLEYPYELHDPHSDYPLAPEQRVPPGSKDKKLLLTLSNKEKYVLHYRNLKQYISYGLILKKIHRAVRFSQSAWLKSYIDLNTNMRTQAQNEFEKDFFKLMNNSVFGKTMENILNRVDIRLATKEKQVDKWMAQPNFKSRTIFTEQLAAVHMSKTRLLFNKTIYVGMSILDISKTLMYEFHYDVIKKNYGDKAQLQYTDTDSLTYLIETENFYNDMKRMIDCFDTSDYPEPNRYNLPRVNKKIIGKFKDELNGRIMFEHVGLKSKMYASRSEIDPKKPKKIGQLKKAKGVKKSVVEEEITFQDYKNCLEKFASEYSTTSTTLEAQRTYKCDLYKSMNQIRSYQHDLYSVELNKIVLSALDDKRYILDGGIKTLPWGHYSISEDVMLDRTIMDALMAE